MIKKLKNIGRKGENFYYWYLYKR